MWRILHPKPEAARRANAKNRMTAERIQAFDHPEDASHVIDDMATHGVSKDAISLVVSDDELDVLDRNSVHWIGDECHLVVTRTYEELGLNGGAIGAVGGCIAGSLSIISCGSTGWMFVLSMIGAAVAGSTIGAASSCVFSRLKRSMRLLLLRSGYRYDFTRTLHAGAVGGFYGAILGVAMMYSAGSDFFIYVLTAAIACAGLIGALVGYFKARLLNSRCTKPGHDLGDPMHDAIVSDFRPS